LFIRQGPPRRLLWEQLEQKTPQERSEGTEKLTFFIMDLFFRKKKGLFVQI